LIGALGALLVLPLMEIIFFFGISGGRQSLRGGFDIGHVDKYIGIVFFYLIPHALLLVGSLGVVVLLVAKLVGKFRSPFILLASLPAAIVGIHVYMLILEPDDFPLPAGLWLLAAFAGAASALTFCLVGRVAWRAPTANSVPVTP
jgi:hypothetical protein